MFFLVFPVFFCFLKDAKRIVTDEKRIEATGSNPFGIQCEGMRSDYASPFSSASAAALASSMALILS